MILGYPLLPNRKNSCACNHSRFRHCSYIPHMVIPSSVPLLVSHIPRLSSIPSLKYPVPQLSHPSRVPSLEGPILPVSPLMRVPSFVSPLPKTSLPRVYIPRSHIAVYIQLTYRTQETVYGSSIHVRIVHYSCFDHICWSADCCSDQS